MTPGRYCMRLSRSLHQRRELVEAVLGEVGQGPFQARPDALDRVELPCVRRQLVGGQPKAGVDLRHRAADVRVQIDAPVVCQPRCVAVPGSGEALMHRKSSRAT